MCVCVCVCVCVCDLKYMDSKNIHNLSKITNISLLFRSFISVNHIDKASEKKRNICDFK